ncbi:molybdenum cofactor guanylyltransferase MobA [Pseudothioclava arenosa]|uniref:molybdenum cofactor guanylyltransferase MobA n=1 Tax=Pseudothioclava arenosa TaxID=1795308 RepID=UPI00117C6552|nr:molybdenum cofactor guanylyltransferase MobA [Pseudothioclava arenosa]
MTEPQSEIAGLILAGGRGIRMGGIDKALLPLMGRPLVDHVLTRLAPQLGPIAVSANGNPARFEPWGLPVLRDGFMGEGPLAGLMAGLGWAEAQGAKALVTVAVDTPFVPADLVARLADRGVDLPVVAASGGRRHPTVALWPVSEAPRIAEAFAEGERRLGAVLSGARSVDFSAAPDPFFNINTPADLDAAELRLRAAP